MLEIPTWFLNGSSKLLGSFKFIILLQEESLFIYMQTRAWSMFLKNIIRLLLGHRQAAGHKTHRLVDPNLVFLSGLDPL